MSRKLRTGLLLLCTLVLLLTLRYRNVYIILANFLLVLLLTKGAGARKTAPDAACQSAKTEEQRMEQKEEEHSCRHY